MAERYVLVKAPSETQPQLVPEQSVGQELWLQEQVKLHTELIPAADFDLRTPLLVVGRETGLGEAGAADLIAVDMTGEVLVAEFKRGPDNPDARRVVAQLLDYGAQLFGMSFDDFDQKVARRYFGSSRCHDRGLAGKSLEEAASALWGQPDEGSDGDPAEFDPRGFREKLGQHLSEGSLTYLVISTRITERVRAVLEYLSSTASFRAFGVEISHFSDGDLSVFVPRSLASGRRVGQPARTNRSEFMSQLTAHGRDILEHLLERLDDTGERIYWGTLGFSFRPDFGQKSLTLIYGFPAGEGHDSDLLQVYFPYLEEAVGHDSPVAENYRKATERLPGFEYTKTRKTGNMRLTPEFTREHVDQLMQAVDAVLRARDEANLR